MPVHPVCEYLTRAKVKVSLLIGHKSAVYKCTTVRLGGYIFSGSMKQIANGEEPTPIIPILLYHGKNKWTYHTLKDLFKEPNPEWQQYIPDFDYIYHDLGEVPDGQPEVIGNSFLRASLLALKHSYEQK